MWLLVWFSLYCTLRLTGRGNSKCLCHIHFLSSKTNFIKANFPSLLRQRPYHVEHTGSRPITEVKQHWAWLVLGWVTAWEHQVLLALFIYTASFYYKKNEHGMLPSLCSSGVVKISIYIHIYIYIYCFY